MPNVAEYFPSNYLKASDLKGASPIVAIDRVEYEAVGRSKEMKPIVYFQGKEKGLVLNKTNCNTIVQIAQSPVTEEWAGVKIQLFATMVEFQGAPVEALRVKAPVRKATKPVAAPAPTPVPQQVVDDIDDEFGNDAPAFVDADDPPF
jgi:hypothetical protein